MMRINRAAEQLIIGGGLKVIIQIQNSILAPAPSHLSKKNKNTKLTRRA